MKKFLIAAVCSYFSFICPLCSFAEVEDCGGWKDSFNDITNNYYLPELNKNTSDENIIGVLEKRRKALQDLIQINCKNEVSARWVPSIQTITCIVGIVTAVFAIAEIMHHDWWIRWPNRQVDRDARINALADGDRRVANG